MATKKATKQVEYNEKNLFTKEQVLNSNKYADKKDVCKTVIPDNFNGTLNEVDILIEKFMKGKVK